MVVDIDDHPAERQPAVHPGDAGQLLQREAALARETELHHACRSDLVVFVDARDEQAVAAAGAPGR